MSAALPSLSVVVPTFHRNADLARCLERLAPHVQTLSPEAYEVIVSDDGVASTAESLVRERFSWVRWVPGPRNGPAANRNCGARFARGEWLVFTDDDCLPEPGWLQAFAAAPPDRGILEGRTITDRPEFGPFETAPINERGGLLWSCNLAVRARVFRELGGFDDMFPSPHLEDVDFRVRARRAGVAMEFVPAATVVHPPRAVASVWRQVKQERSYFYFARKHQMSLREAGLSAHAFLRGRYGALRRSRSTGEAVRYAARAAIDGVLLAGACVWWGMTGR